MREWWRRQFGPNLPLWFAFWVWVGMTAGVIGRVIVVPPDRGSVVPIYLTAGGRWLAGDPLYAPAPGLDVFRNPPGVATFFALPSLLPDKFAAIVWRLAGLAGYAISIHRLVRDVLPPLGNWRASGVWVAAAVLMIPALNNGQFNLPLTAMAVGGTVASVKGRWWLAAALLAVCGYVKLYTFAVGLLFVVQAPRKFGPRFALLTAACVALPFVCQHPGYVFDRHEEFVRARTDDDRTTSDHSRAPRDWSIIPYDVTGTPLPKVWTLGVSLAAAAGFAVVVWRQKRALPESALTPLALGLIWIPLFGPGSEVNLYSILAPVAAVFAVGLPGVSRFTKWLSWVGSAGLLAVEIRAGGTGTDWDLSWLQPLGAAALMVAVVKWSAGVNPRETVSGTGGI